LSAWGERHVERRKSNWRIDIATRLKSRTREKRMSGALIQSADLHRCRARALMDLADNTLDLVKASDLLVQAAKQLELAAREDASQHQQAQPEKD
jgi:hypothetical protein